MKERVAPTPLSALASFIMLLFFLLVLWRPGNWALATAVWSGDNREVCSAEGAGACWPFAKAKLLQWIYGASSIPLTSGGGLPWFS